jgi:hypothetical protein
MDNLPIDDIVSLREALRAKFDEKLEPSMILEIDRNCTKLLVLTCSSVYELFFSSELLRWVDETTNGHKTIVEFVRKKAVEKQFHTFFDWDKKNANQFYNKMGNTFSEDVKKEIEKNELRGAERTFLKIVNVRNNVAHANASIDYTFDEVLKMHNEAVGFLEFLFHFIKNYEKSMNQ